MVDRYRQRGQRLDELAAHDPFESEAATEDRSQARRSPLGHGQRDSPSTSCARPSSKADREMVLAAASVLNRSIATAELEPILEVHQDEGWRLHQPAIVRQGGFHESGMWPFPRQI
jgi:hypothetical protein